MARLDLPQPLKIELISPASSPAPGTPDEKLADWAAAVQQLRDIAQWIVGGVIAAIVAVFASTAFARLGNMDPVDDLPRLILAAVGFLVAIVAISTIFFFGIRVIVPSGLNLEMLASGTTKEDARAREFLYRLNDVDQKTFGLAKLLKQYESAAARQYLPDFLRTLSFVVVKTRFDTLVKALTWALVVAVPGLLLFIWAANPPEGHGKAPMQTVTTTYDVTGAITQRQVTLEQPRPATAPASSSAPDG